MDSAVMDAKMKYVELLVDKHYPFPAMCCKLTRAKIEGKREALRQRLMKEIEQETTNQ